jgi:hypothetical protein
MVDAGFFAYDVEVWVRVLVAVVVTVGLYTVPV